MQELPICKGSCNFLQSFHLVHAGQIPHLFQSFLPLCVNHIPHLYYYHQLLDATDHLFAINFFDFTLNFANLVEVQIIW